jgi:hypothetical protein
MTALILLGDDLPTLAALGETCAAESATTSAPRAVVVGVDIRRSPSNADAKRAIRAHLTAAEHDIRVHSAVRHLIVVIHAAERMTHLIESHGSAAATRIHAHLERRLARDIEVTVLDLSACASPAAAAQRIQERARTPAGAHAVVVLSWSDIETTAIATAARQQYV